MSKKLTVLHYNSNSGNKPSASDLSYGEIAIGYKTDNEAIFIKNDNDDVIAFKPNANSTIVKITYNDLKTLRDNKKLNPSSWYRITDFVTTVANDDEARSANHPFDIIVFASDNNVLQEEAFAALHEGDMYFKDCDLNAWKIWYCIDNDITRFQWADTTNGKGVIYRMIDEWQNDCPYDFKNVQYKRYKVIDNSPNGELSDLDGTYIGYRHISYVLSIDDYDDFKWAYTFTLIDENDEWVDYSSKPNKFDDDVSYFIQMERGRCEYNLIRHFYSVVAIEDAYYQVQSLNNIVLISILNGNVAGEMLLNTFGVGNYNMTLKGSPEENNFGDKCHHNIVGSYGNTFGNNCYENTFGRNCDGNTFGNDCTDNTFGNNCYENTFGNGCWGNTFGNGCNDNTFGNRCCVNKFGDSFQSNTIGNNVKCINVLGENVYHTNILNGTSGDSKKLLVINFETEKNYSQFAGFDSNGELQIWVDADLGDNGDEDGDGEGDDNIIITTYTNLKSMRDDSELIPGKRYRITDFVTTVANDDEARSANHPFDVIVLATDTNVLQEEAFTAMPSNGDTYFKDCNLNAWKIWYCIDNDNTRFQWADSVNGKGVIYRMIDEFGNDCPYDFKNVQYKRFWSNGIKTSDGTIILKGYYAHLANKYDFTEGTNDSDYLWCYTFTRLQNVEEGYSNHLGQNIVLDESVETTRLDFDSGDDKKGTPNCYNFHSRCSNNIFKPSYCGVYIDRTEYMCMALLNNVIFTILIEETDILVYQPPYDNNFGMNCVNNTFGANFWGDIFLASCINNTFGNKCCNNKFDIHCVNNTFGDGCGNNTFGKYCMDNTFGDNCDGNTFGYSCERNAFGKYCDVNTFGNTCYDNTFGRNGWHNIFGSGCHGNTFGNYFYYNTLGESVKYVKVTTDNVQFTQILNGTQGKDYNKLTINFSPNTTYSQKAGFNSSNTLRIWVEADLV